MNRKKSPVEASSTGDFFRITLLQNIRVIDIRFIRF